MKAKFFFDKFLETRNQSQQQRSPIHAMKSPIAKFTYTEVSDAEVSDAEVSDVAVRATPLRPR